MLHEDCALLQGCLPGRELLMEGSPHGRPARCALMAIVLQHVYVSMRRAFWASVPALPAADLHQRITPPLPFVAVSTFLGVEQIS